MGIRIGIADTTFARVDMAPVAQREIKETLPDAEIIRYTVPGIKDLPVAAKRLLDEKGCDIVMAMGMPGPEAVDKQTALASVMGLIWAELLTNKHVVEVFVHEDEAANDRELYGIAVERSRKHAHNLVKLCTKPEEMTRDAGMGKRQGKSDVGPIRRLK